MHLFNLRLSHFVSYDEKNLMSFLLILFSPVKPNLCSFLLFQLLAAFKTSFFLLETIFVFLLIAAVPINAHATVVSISVVNMSVVAWFWYNSVRCVDVRSDGGLNFWIGNIELEVPFDKIINIKRINITTPCSIVSAPLLPHRGYLSDPSDGVAIITSLSCTPFWAWPRSPLKAPRRCCCDAIGFPNQVLVFSPAGGSLNFIREVETEMRGGGGGTQQLQQPPSADPRKRHEDTFDV